MIPTWSAVLSMTGDGDPVPLDSLGAWQVVLGRTAPQGLCCPQALPSGRELSTPGRGTAAAPTQPSSARAVGIHPSLCTFSTAVPHRNTTKRPREEQVKNIPAPVSPCSSPGEQLHGWAWGQDVHPSGQPHGGRM